MNEVITYERRKNTKRKKRTIKTRATQRPQWLHDERR